MTKQPRLPAEQRKRVIIRAAIQEFSNSNFRVAKVSDIATRSNVTDPIIYRFFDSKKDLFLDVLKITSSRTLEHLTGKDIFNFERIKSKVEFRNGLVESIWGYLSTMEKYRKEIKIYYQAISEIDDPDINKVIRQAYQSYADLYQSAFEQAKENGIVDENVNTRIIAWDIIGFAIHQSSLFVMNFYNEEDAKEVLLQRVQIWV